jgi:hypothetical protein
MGPRTRKAIAGVGMLAFLAGYIWAAVTVSAYVPAVWWAQVPYFAIVGTAWGLPLLPLFKWAEKGDERGGGPRP